MILNESEIRNFLSGAGFSGNDLNKAVNICSCESSFDTEAHNLTNREDSRGLMQINLIAHPEYNNINLFDPAINCMVAYQLYNNRGKNFKDWTCAYILGYEKKNSEINPEDKILIVSLAIITGIVLYYI